jgi:hypothetical protein
MRDLWRSKPSQGLICQIVLGSVSASVSASEIANGERPKNQLLGVAVKSLPARPVGTIPNVARHEVLERTVFSGTFRNKL